MNCSKHPQAGASGSCVHCGKLFCEDCLIEVDGKYYCKEHVKLLINPEKDLNRNDFNRQPNTSGWAPAQRPEEGYYNGRDDGSYNNYGQPPNIYINNNNQNDGFNSYYHRKSRVIAILLCLFFGCGGFHRFYVGKIGTGLLWMFTSGFFGIGALVDLIMLIIGTFRDGNGQLLE